MRENVKRGDVSPQGHKEREVILCIYREKLCGVFWEINF